MIRPLGDNIVVKFIEEEQQTSSGIVLPDTASKERPEQGEVVAIGPNVSAALAQGDRVLFKKYCPDEVVVNDETLFILAEADVLAVIE